MNTDNSNYERVVKKLWRGQHLPEELLEYWQSLVNDFETGCSNINVDDYYSDLRVRSELEDFLSLTELQDLPDFRDFLNRVTIVDDKFRSLLLPEYAQEKKPWEGRAILMENTFKHRTT